MEAGLTVTAMGTIGFTVKFALTPAPPVDAVMTEGVVAVTVPAVAVKVAVVNPCATTTDAGTDTAALELESVTVIPPVGAEAEMVTVPCDVCPLNIEAVLNERLEGTIGFTVKLALIPDPPLEAVSTTAVAALTIPAVAVNDTLVAPCGTVTEPGTDTAAFELESATTIQPVGAAAEMVTVPCVVCPLKITIGARDRAEGTIGLIVRFAVLFTPAADPVITTAVEALTTPAVAVNVAVVAP
jgi:hypothetical protein